MTKKLNKKGFTLTELIVVIAIIAILAAVLIPTSVVFIGRAKDNADLQDATNAYKAWSAYATTYAGSNVEKEAALAEVQKVVFVGSRNGEVYTLQDGTMKSTEKDLIAFDTDRSTYQGSFVLVELQVSNEAAAEAGYVCKIHTDDANDLVGVTADHGTLQLAPVDKTTPSNPVYYTGWVAIK